MNFTWFALLCHQNFHDRPLFKSRALSLNCHHLNIFKIIILTRLTIVSLLTDSKQCRVYIHYKKRNILKTILKKCTVIEYFLNIRERKGHDVTYIFPVFQQTWNIVSQDSVGIRILRMYHLQREVIHEKSCIFSMRQK